jgi:hypothetical protein
MALSFMFVGVILTCLLLVSARRRQLPRPRQQAYRNADAVPAQVEAKQRRPAVGRTFSTDVMNVVNATGIQASASRCGTPTTRLGNEVGLVRFVYNERLSPSGVLTHTVD